jgi:amino acid permease
MIKRTNRFGNFLYVLAIILVTIWAFNYFLYNAGDIIHILLVLAVIALLVRVIRGNSY